jgi:preprotein translocase subunit SecB
MSETATNGQATERPQGPVLLVNAQYLRDFSFENPRAPESLMNQNEPPEVKIELDVKVRQLNTELFESVLTAKVEAKQGQQTAFVIEVDYGAVVTIQNANQDVTAALLLIETPRLIFPYVRNIISDATRDGGFPPLMINPVDFAELHRRKSAEAQAAAPTNLPPAS